MTSASTSYGLLIGSMAFHSESWSELPNVFARLESNGCDGLWFTDHLFSGYPSGEAFVLASAAAVSTKNCTIGTGILQLPLRRTASVAKAASTLQLLSDGRFVLGVGVGQHLQEFENVGVEFNRRGAEADRALEELTELWRPSEGWFAVRPAATAPIWVGGHSDPALRRASRFGSGWMPFFLSPERFTKSNILLDEMLSAEGRRPESLSRAITLVVGATDPKWSSDDALEWAGKMLPTGSAGIEKYVVTGSTEECVEQIRVFERAGASAALIIIAHPDHESRFAELSEALREPQR